MEYNSNAVSLLLLVQNSLISRRVTAPDLARNPYAGPELSPEEMQTIVWTRDLNKVDPRDIEACEDLLDAYFLMVNDKAKALSSFFYVPANLPGQTKRLSFVLQLHCLGAPRPPSPSLTKNR